MWSASDWGEVIGHFSRGNRVFFASRRHRVKLRCDRHREDPIGERSLTRFSRFQFGLGGWIRNGRDASLLESAGKGVATRVLARHFQIQRSCKGHRSGESKNTVIVSEFRFCERKISALNRELPGER